MKIQITALLFYSMSWLNFVLIILFAKVFCVVSLVGFCFCGLYFWCHVQTKPKIMAILCQGVFTIFFSKCWISLVLIFKIFVALGEFYVELWSSVEPPGARTQACFFLHFYESLLAVLNPHSCLCVQGSLPGLRGL